MRVRTDSFYQAGWKRAILLGARPNPLDDDPSEWAAEYLAFLRAPDNEARPGDCWVLRQQPRGRTVTWNMPDEPESHLPIIGYTLVCPLEHCESGVHRWAHAYDCEGVYDLAKCKGGHPGCWTWTGSPEDDTLTATPSLLSLIERGGCGWHGFLRNGVMVLA